MGMVVRTNTMAINAQRQLNLNNNAVSKSLEKLASGYKINRAADDAAGLAISERMKAQIVGLEAASSNSQDGISVVQTAEGALNEVHDMLNRMVELATKAANGVYTDTQRANYADEVTQLQDEIDRIAESTNFNGIKLLDGTMGLNSSAITVVGKQVASEGGVVATTGWGNLGTVQNQDTVVNSGAVAAATSAFVVDLNGITASTGVADQNFQITIGTTTISADITAAGVTNATALANLFNNQTVSIGGATFNITADAGKLTFTMTTTTGVAEGAAALNPNFNVSVKFENGSTGVVQGTQDIAITGVTAGNLATDAQLANAVFDIDVSKITNGSTLKIGDQTYTFAVGEEGKELVDNFAASATAVLVDLSDYDQGELAGMEKAIYQKLTNASNSVTDNARTWDVGINNDGKLTITENLDYLNNANGHDGDSPYTTVAEIQRDVVFTTGDIAGGTTLSLNAANLKDGNSITVGGVQLTFTSDPNAVGNQYVKIGGGQDAVANLQSALQGNGFTVDLKNNGDLFISKENAPVEILGSGLTLQVGDTSDDFNKLNVSVNDMHADALGVAAHQIDITTQEGAGAAIDIINNAIDSVSRTRSSLGAIQNRLEHTINSLDTTTENLQSANSRIRDTDMAKEMMEYTKMNVLVQSAQAMLAQANQQPQSVLQLLQ